MYMPSIFGSDMFEDFFRDLDQGYAPKALYGKRAKNLMKTDIREDEKGRMIRQERYAGSVQRSFFVGEQLKEEDIKAKYEDGVLKLEIPKKEEEKKLPERRYIEIS